MILDSEKSQIMILARTKNTLKTYIVSLANNFQVTPQSEKTIEQDFTSVSISKSFFLLNGSEATQVLDHNL